MQTSVGHRPKGKWAFDEQVTSCFDDMLERSIPDLKSMRYAVNAIVKRFARKGKYIVDLGCSTGGAIANLIDSLRKNHFIGLEKSQSMVEEAKRRFKEKENVTILHHDLRNGLPFPWKEEIGVILSVLTMQFLPVEYRQAMINEIYSALEDGGVFILVEKVLGDDWKLNDLLVSLYYDLKKQNGYSMEDIETKRISLEGVLVPLTFRENERMLRKTGFSHVECFWRFYNFAGWIAIK